MNLGLFSLSLPVRDIEKSSRFYQALGFTVIDGGHRNKKFPDTDSCRWRILQSDETVISLFEGGIKDLVLAFNPPDLNQFQQALSGQDIPFEAMRDEAEDEPVTLSLRDPDGRQITLTGR
jgi:catechol 2,3-dioxygenase-like lactoylglutathione lyase family enzyme